MNIIRYAIFSVFLSASSYADLPSDPIEYKAWEDKMLYSISQQKSASPYVAIPKLTLWITQLSTDGSTNREKGSQPVLNAAKSALVSIPGHAKYYQNKIESMRLEVLANSKKSDDEIVDAQSNGQEILFEADYLSYAENSIRTLRFLPSAETVAVLGHFLNDPEGEDGKTLLGNPRGSDDSPPRDTNAEQAAKSMAKIGIENPPFQTSRPNPHNGIREGELKAWRDWWNEVRDGNRTYRFIGSKIEYGPDGPASAEAIQRSERNSKRDAEREAGHKKSSANSEGEPAITQISKPSYIAGIVTALVLCLVAVWSVWRRKKAAQG